MIPTNSLPSAPATLSAIPGLKSLRFQWSAGNDAETPQAALSYGLRIGSHPGGADILGSDASTSGLRRVVQLGHAGQSRSLTLTNLSFGNYYYALQTVDFEFACSPFSAEQALVYVAGTLAPTNVTSTGATLNGVLTASGLPTVAYFQWGPGTNLGN